MESLSFWQLVTRSGLLPPALLETLRTRQEAEFAERENPPGRKELAAWLQSQGSISEYQAQILGAGHAGPFVYGEYLVESPAARRYLEDCFFAKHRATGHPVMLQFIPGRKPSDREHWREVEKLSARVRGIECRHLVPVFETVSLPHHRMIVTGRPPGQPLAALVPPKSRMPWADACVVTAQIAEALHALHRQDIIHNAVSPRTVWTHRSGLAQLKMALRPDLRFDRPDPAQQASESRLDYLAPEAYVETTVDSPQLSWQSDLYALGCVLFRAVTGRVVFAEEEIPRKRWLHANAELPDIARYELPDALVKLLHQLLAKTPEERPESAREVARTLAKLAGDRLKIKSVPGITPARTPSWEPFQKSLRRWNPGSEAPDEVEVKIEGIEPIARAESLSGPALDERIERARELARKRKRTRWMLPAAIATAMLLTGITVALIAYVANQKSFALRMENPETDQAPRQETTGNDGPGPDVSQNTTADKSDTSSVRLVQTLIADDRATLWESPTVAPPPRLDYLPDSPRMLFVVRPLALMKTDEGPRLLQGFGPGFADLLRSWQKDIGLELLDIQRVVVTLHAGSGPTYDCFCQVELPEPAPHERLLQLWRSPSPTILDTGETIHELADGRAFYCIPDSSGAGLSRRFVFGPSELVREVIAIRGANAWSGPFQRISQQLDRERHLSLVYLRQALFNDQGQRLMGGPWSGLNRQLQLILNDSIRAGLVSLHVDEGTYLELAFELSAAMAADELAEELETRLGQQLDRLSKFIFDAPEHPYWENALPRFIPMFRDAFGQLRIGVEYGEVWANAWLAPMAAHNLVAATELLVNFAGSGNALVADDTPDRQIPQTLEELLQAPRDLTVTTNPDLNILLQQIRSEVTEDHGQLPFDFQIRLLGNDLQLEGITQNQRPGDFEMTQIPLAEILTEIMVRCNPQKDISGPADPNCKLVWVVDRDPENPESRAVLITTRAAAAERGYELPPVFQPKSDQGN